MKKILLVVIAIVSVNTYTLWAQQDSAAHYLQKGKEEKDARRYMVAYGHLEKAITFDPNNYDAHMALGYVSMEMRKYEPARVAFTKALELKKDDTSAITQLTNIYFFTRKWPEAIQYAKKAQQLKLGTRNHYIIAKCNYEQENYGETIKYLELAYKDDPKNPEVPYLAGRSFIEMSNYKRAAGCYEQAIALDSSKTQWMYEAGMAYYAIPDDAKAIYWFEKAGDKGHKRTNDYIENLANAYLNVKNYEKGVPLLTELLQRKPGDLELLYNVGDAYYRTKKYQEAIDTWDKILALDSKNARALYMIGMAYQKKGDTAKGQQLCDKAIAMDPALASLKQQTGGGGL